MSNQDEDKLCSTPEILQQESKNSDEDSETLLQNSGMEIEKLVSENQDLKDKNLRLIAEMENLRRRNMREVQETRSYAVAAFARDMLIVSDDLRRGLEALPEEAKLSKEPGFLALIEGVELTEKTMLSTLERHGIKKIIAKGQKFDPNFHQAMFEAPHPDFPAGTVIQAIQTGYSIGDRVLRPAMVGVSSGPPKKNTVPLSDESAG